MLLHSEGRARAGEVGDSAVPTRLSTFVSFDRRVSATTFHQRPDRYRHLEASLGSTPRIARGAGFSYSAASFGSGIVVQQMTAFTRILAFDEATAQVTVEAGTTIGDLMEWASARGLCVPVVPGHPAITVGGCIAGDVHGKNAWHVGTFRDWTRAITLYRPDVSYVTVSREARREEFEATCGGFGLTGLIVSAALQLVPAPGYRLRVASSPVESFEDAAQMLIESRAPFSYSWHAGIANAAKFGSGLVFQNYWDANSATVPPARRNRFDRRGASEAPGLRIWNPYTLAVASSGFRLAHVVRTERTVSLFEAFFPIRGYGLYHRLFGSGGFGEMQLLVPATAIGQFFSSFRRVVAAQRPTIAFISMKAFRGRSQALGLSGEGVLFAVDYPAASSANLEAAIDELVLDLGAQPNLAKDSRIGRRIAERSFPHFSSFAEAIHRMDPHRYYQSDLSRRLSI